MKHETVSVTTQAEWDAAITYATAIDVLPGIGRLTLDLRGRPASPRIHVAGEASVVTCGPIELSCAGRIVVNDGAVVELIPNGRAHVAGGTVHARAGTVVEAVGGEIDCQAGCTIFTPQRGSQTLTLTMAPGVMWWDRDGAAYLTKRDHTTHVTETTIRHERHHPKESQMKSIPSAIESTLRAAVEALTRPPLPPSVTVAIPPSDLIVTGGNDD